MSSTQHGGCHCNAALDTGAGYKDAHILQCSLGWLCEVKIWSVTLFYPTCLIVKFKDGNF